MSPLDGLVENTDRADVLDHLADLLSPRWSTLGLAAAATLVVSFNQWRTWDTGGDRTGWTEFHFYWPWYVWSHGDYVVGPNPGLLLASFLTGVALWYLPAALVTGLLRSVTDALGVEAHVASFVPSPVDDAINSLERVCRFRSKRALVVTVLAFLLSLVPVAGILVLLPGVALLAWGIGVSYAIEFVPNDFDFYLYVPVSLVCWYLTTGVLLAVTRWVASVVSASTHAANVE